MRISRSFLALLAVGVLLGTTACLPEDHELETEVIEPIPEPIPEPEPEPVSLPGNGPDCPTDHCVSVTVSGDLLFHEGLWTPYAIPLSEEGHSFDFEPLLEGLKPYFEKSDLNICQSETPFAEFGGPYLGFPFFNTPPELAHAAKKVGFDACTTASNHSVDQGTDGLVRTLDLWDSVGVKTTGTYRTPEEHDEILILDANGAKVALITSTFSLNGLYAEADWQVDYPLEAERVIEKAKRAREMGADLVLHAFHAGEEYWNEPNWQQVEHAEMVLSSGEVDFAYSHHAHAVQPFEQIGDRWVLYGTGNLISESAPPERYMNNEFLLTRVQFAKQDDDSWTTNNISWTSATNIQDGGYKWCSVNSDHPQGVCQGEGYDAEVRQRINDIVYFYDASPEVVTEWLVSEEG